MVCQEVTLDGVKRVPLEQFYLPHGNLHIFSQQIHIVVPLRATSNRIKGALLCEQFPGAFHAQWLSDQLSPW